MTYVELSEVEEWRDDEWVGADGDVGRLVKYLSDVRTDCGDGKCHINRLFPQIIGLIKSWKKLHEKRKYQFIRFVLYWLVT